MTLPIIIYFIIKFYGILGNNLQFESLKEALGEGLKFVHAVETGLSADPTMIRGILELNKIRNYFVYLSKP